MGRRSGLAEAVELARGDEHRRVAAGTRRLGAVWWYGGATALALLFVGPFFWALSSSLKAPAELYVFPPALFPAVPRFGNYLELWTELPFGVFARNSLIVAFFNTVGQTVSAAAVAYGFARFRFPGRNALFVLVLSTLMLPQQVTIIPLFLMYKQAGWLDTYLPLTVPQLFGGSAFFVFLIRQFFLTLPLELDEAAEIDGAGTLRVFWSILLPLSKPVLATCAIFAFLFSWNEFLEPLIYLNNRDLFTLPLGLRYLSVLPEMNAKPKEHLMMGAAVLFALPPIALFFALQRYFVRGIVMSGIKG
ncbi:MAG TPA: carbohydrate ABC transporter permease [Chloroflexota bacterium]|jgi:ABC-type glycerol-3-phosphate transport system permease component